MRTLKKYLLNVLLANSIACVLCSTSFVIQNFFSKRISKITQRYAFRIKSFWIDHFVSNNNRDDIIAFVDPFMYFFSIVSSIQNDIGYVKRVKFLFESIQ